MNNLFDISRMRFIWMINFSNRHSYTYITRHTKRRAPYIYFRYNSCVSSQIQIQIQIQKYEHHISIFAINLMCHHQASHSLLRVSLVWQGTQCVTKHHHPPPFNIIQYHLHHHREQSLVWQDTQCVTKHHHPISSNTIFITIQYHLHYHHHNQNFTHHHHRHPISSSSSPRSAQ